MINVTEIAPDVYRISLFVVKRERSYSRQLRLPGFRKNYQSLREEMSGDKMDYNDYLGRLLELEYQERIERRKKLRIKLAGFPQLKYLQELSLDDLPQDAQEKLPSIKSMDFIESGQNIILSGLRSLCGYFGDAIGFSRYLLNTKFRKQK